MTQGQNDPRYETMCQINLHISQEKARPNIRAHTAQSVLKYHLAIWLPQSDLRFHSLPHNADF